MGGRAFRNYYKGNKDKAKGEDGSKGGRWFWLGSGDGGRGGEKMKTSVIEQQ